MAFIFNAKSRRLGCDGDGGGCRWLTVVSGLALAVLLFAAWQPVQAQWMRMLERGGVPSLAPMIKEVSPAVVHISVVGDELEQRRRHPFEDNPTFRRFFGEPPQSRQPRRRPVHSQGSGVVVDPGRGHIITNHHVIEKASEITVTLQDGREFEAELVGSDPEVDIAVLHIDATGLATIDIGDSDALQVGDFVVAIGNPFGLKQTVTVGIVSGLGRSGLGIEGYEDFIQTDASINIGNSGGALLNLKGELVGINTAILAPGGGSVGIGFAIPMRMASSLANQIVTHGEVQRGRIGVYIDDFTPELAEYFDLDPSRRGALVTRVQSDSPAERAGIEIGDLVVSVDDRDINGAADLRNAVGLLRPGTTVRIGYIRSGARRNVRVRIEKPEPERQAGADMHRKLEGTLLEEYEAKSGSDNFQGEGIAIVEVEDGSTAWGHGLRAEDVIVSINRRRVDTIEEARTLLSLFAGDRLLLQIWRPGAGAMYLLI